ncbi:hypothetical protein EB001_07900 [bacterium]|nr:hypothetical protein [bacterium]
MEALHFKRTLHNFVNQSNVESKLLATFRAIEHIQDLRLDLELSLHVARCIEIEVSVIPPNKKPNKLELFIRIMNALFNLNESEVKILTNQVDVLHSMGKIKGISVFKKISHSVGSWITKKIL